MDHADFVAGEHSTNWLESGAVDLTGITGRLSAADPEAAPADDGTEPESKVRRDVDVEVNGKRFAVSMWVPESQLAAAPASGGGTAKAKPRRKGGASSGAGGAGTGVIVAPMQGTMFKVNVAVGDAVEAGQVVAVLEAMKMENNVSTDVSGTVAEVKVEPGQSVGSGDVLVIITPTPAEA